MGKENGEQSSTEYLGVMVTDTDSHHPTTACLVDPRTGRVLNFMFQAGTQLEIGYENGILDQGNNILGVKGTVSFEEADVHPDSAVCTKWRATLSDPEINIEGVGKFRMQAPFIPISLRFGDSLRIGDSEPIIIEPPH